MTLVPTPPKYLALPRVSTALPICGRFPHISHKRAMALPKICSRGRFLSTFCQKVNPEVYQFGDFDQRPKSNESPQTCFKKPRHPSTGPLGGSDALAAGEGWGICPSPHLRARLSPCTATAARFFLVEHQMSVSVSSAPLRFYSHAERRRTCRETVSQYSMADWKLIICCFISGFFRNQEITSNCNPIPNEHDGTSFAGHESCVI